MRVGAPALVAGVFGKIPSFGDFVARGTGSPTGRAFERWLQQANDRLAELGRGPGGPVGFLFRDEGGESLLVGTLVASVDRVGRRFPLALFCEVGGPFTEIWTPAIAVALGSVLEQLGGVAHRARRGSVADLLAALDRIAIPSASDLVAACAEQRRRLAAASLSEVLSRLFEDPGDRCYAMDVLRRASEGARQSRALRRPLVLDVPGHSDIELMFWLAALDLALEGAIGVPSLLWDVEAGRVLVVLGTPEAGALHCLWDAGARYQRLWPTRTASDDARQRARDRLGEDCVCLLEEGPERTVGEALAALAGARSNPANSLHRP